MSESRTFYQSHSCEGYSAKVTIEWDIPPTTNEAVIAHRLAAAEDIADSILAFSGNKMRDMVQIMRGWSPAQHRPAEASAAEDPRSAPAGENKGSERGPRFPIGSEQP